MIVDLVRNDLSRIATHGSVRVDELCGVYSYPGVHQMISTISARLPEEISIAEILKATFPMGSMTGAPKISAMKLIDRYEGFARNIFSGSIGWKDEVGVVDMNVVIRSLMYDSNRSIGTIRTGGAITHLSDAEDEYRECLLKAMGFYELLLKKDSV
jgi:para-aminobenzoate synthetase component 1